VHGHSFTKRAVCKVGEHASTRESGKWELELEPETGSCSKVNLQGAEGDEEAGGLGEVRVLVRGGGIVHDEREVTVWQAREEFEERMPRSQRVWMNLGALRWVMRKCV